MTLLIDGELFLYGFVGENYWDEGFTAREVLDALAEHGRENPIVAHINSGGGYTDAGISIYNALMTHKGKVTTVNDAMAASAASIIFMAGAERIMRPGSLVMIHDPAGLTYGTADDHRRSIALLDRLGDQMAGIYCDRSGDEVAALRAEMQAELWLTPDEALERRFATSIENVQATTASAFDYRLYAKAPAPLRAMAVTNSWSLENARPKAAASATVPPGPKGDPIMSEQVSADALAAATASGRSDGAKAAQDRIKAIMTSPVAKGHEALAEHFAYNTEDSAEAAIAALTVAQKPAAANDKDEIIPPAAKNDAVAAYDARRAEAAGLAAPGGGKAKSGLSSRIDAQIERSKRA